MAFAWNAGAAAPAAREEGPGPGPAANFAPGPGPRLEQALGAPPALLAASYLATDYSLRLVALARRGAEIHTALEGRTAIIGPENADLFEAAYRERRALYASAIEARGFMTVAGHYEARAEPECEVAGDGLASALAVSGPVALSLRQRGFTLFVMAAHASGPAAGVAGLQGVVVEEVLLVEDTDEPELRFRGGWLGERLVLRPDLGAGAPLPLALSIAERQALVLCAVVLEPLPDES